MYVHTYICMFLMYVYIVAGQQHAAAGQQHAGFSIILRPLKTTSNNAN